MEHEAKVAFVDVDAGEVDAIEDDLAAVECFESGDGAQKCGLAAAAWAKQADDVARGNVEADVAQDGLVWDV